MKKKIILIIIIVVVLLFVLGVLIFIKKNNTTTTFTNDSQEENIKVVNTKESTAEDIIKLMKEKNNNIGKIVVYNEETDLNNLLGRPNQYTSKIQFADNRLDQSYVEENDAKGGTIEVFKSKEDLENRKSYIETLSASASIFVQYIYSKGNALLRLDQEITPNQASEYERIFYEVVK